MSKTWYPVIDEKICIACGACIDKCTHGVYDTGQVSEPVVIAPDNCVQGCKGCGSLCPAEAITYFGDTGQQDGCNCNSQGTGDECEDCGCGGGCDCG